VSVLLPVPGAWVGYTGKRLFCQVLMLASDRLQAKEGTVAHYSVYLETGDDGPCMAHVIDLPGCVVRAPTRDEALRRLPEAIKEYHAWLRAHGEPVRTSGKSAQIDIAGESMGFGPFNRRDAAALFPPDQEPLSPEGMERYFRLMAYNRADLLALTRDLPDELLNWQPYPEAFSLRGLLRHVGNAEEWYVSRVVPPDSLPPEWEDDENLPIFEFLEMERRTAVARLSQLTEKERRNVFYPTAWAYHPEEPWTARKALRRFLEHEREHIAQVREILDGYRHLLLARLASERAGFLEQILGLDEQVLVQVPVIGDWTAKDVLAHIATWDRWESRTMQSMVAGEVPDFSALHDLDASNKASIAPWRDQSLGEVLAELQAARTEWIDWLESLPAEEPFRRRSYYGDDWSFYDGPVQVQWEHDAEHAQQIADWRKAMGKAGETGCRAVLLAALDAARHELLAASDLVPEGERDSQHVCGEWTLKDLLGHIADWERFGAEGMRLMSLGQSPEVEPVEDIDAWNLAHVKARREQPWESVWADLHAMRQSLLTVLGKIGEAELAQRFPFPWGPEGTPYQWVTAFFAHDREHAADLRARGGIGSA
jgi:predicted RNase H-like HicB family nuclease/uncharacterized damage-inducible protein DinB